MRHHWFFDLDGTLARTGEDIIAAWKQSLADLGRECPHFDEVFTIGPTLDKVVYQLTDVCNRTAVKCVLGFGNNFSVRELNKGNHRAIKLIGYIDYLVVPDVVSLGNFGLINVEELVQAEEPLVQSTVLVEDKSKAPHLEGVL